MKAWFRASLWELDGATYMGFALCVRAQIEYAVCVNGVLLTEDSRSYAPSLRNLGVSPHRLLRHELAFDNTNKIFDDSIVNRSYMAGPMVLHMRAARCCIESFTMELAGAEGLPVSYPYIHD